MPRRDRDVLLAFHLVGDDAARDRTAGVEAVERLAVARVEREKVAVQIAGEQDVAGGRRQRRVHRRRRLDAPCHLAALRIDSVDPAVPFVDRIVGAPAVRQSGVWNRGDPLRVRSQLEHRAPVDCVDVQHAGDRAVRRSVPLHAGNRAHAHSLGRDRHIVIQNSRHRQLEHVLAVIAIDDMQDALFS